MRQQRESTQEKNRELALENSELEPKFKRYKEQLRQKCIEAEELKEQYEHGFKELSEFLVYYSIDCSFTHH